MTRRWGPAALGLLLALPLLAQMPGTGASVCMDPARRTLIYQRRPFLRPVTDLRLAKSGDDAVLTWTVSPEGTYHYIITRGLLQPTFSDAVQVGETDLLTWTDEDALIREVMGVPVDEYYYVWATGELPGKAPLAPKLVYHENLAPPKASQSILKVTVTNADQFSQRPELAVEGRDHNWAMPPNTTTVGTYLYSAENFPSAGGVAGLTVAAQGKVQEYTGTVDHLGYYSGTRRTQTPTGNVTLEASTTRAVPQPAAVRDGNAVSLTWTEPVQDVAGTLVSFELHRTYLGVGAGEPEVLVATGPIATLQAADDIAAIPANDYCFWHLVLVYADGRKTDPGPSTAPLRR